MKIVVTELSAAGLVAMFETPGCLDMPLFVSLTALLRTSRWPLDFRSLVMALVVTVVAACQIDVWPLFVAVMYLEDDIVTLQVFLLSWIQTLYSVEAVELVAVGGTLLFEHFVA